jgi:hypothetical protein
MCENRTQEEDEQCLGGACSTVLVEPRRGRLVAFSSGEENLHGLRKVTKGARLVMSMWFTCDESMAFDMLDTVGAAGGSTGSSDERGTEAAEAAEAAAAAAAEDDDEDDMLDL